MTDIIIFHLIVATVSLGITIVVCAIGGALTGNTRMRTSELNLHDISFRHHHTEELIFVSEMPFVPRKGEQIVFRDTVYYVQYVSHVINPNGTSITVFVL